MSLKMRLLIILYVVLYVGFYSLAQNLEKKGEIIEFNNCEFIESRFELKCIKYGTYNFTRENSPEEKVK